MMLATGRRPWLFAAVCVMVTAMTLLVFGLTQVPAVQMLPGYAAAYLLIGVCIFGPAGRWPSLSQSLAFLLPGVLLVVLALLDLGFWCGGWLLGLPAWGLLLSLWKPQNRLPVRQVLTFLVLLGLGLLIFASTGTIVVFGFMIFLLPLIPIIQLQGRAAAWKIPAACGDGEPSRGRPAGSGASRPSCPGVDSEMMGVAEMLVHERPDVDGVQHEAWRRLARPVLHDRGAAIPGRPHRSCHAAGNVGDRRPHRRLGHSGGRSPAQ
jgi:hypothetical protein